MAGCAAAALVACVRWGWWLGHGGWGWWLGPVASGAQPYPRLMRGDRVDRRATATRRYVPRPHADTADYADTVSLFSPPTAEPRLLSDPLE